MTAPTSPSLSPFAASADTARSPLDFVISERDRGTIDMVREAIRTGNVALAFQPVVSSSNPGHVSFYEGLIRVFDGAGRTIPARDFIPQVEDTDLGRKLDCLALEMGLEALAEEPGLRLSINMSARSIGYAPWIQTLTDGVQRQPYLAERLIMEITESSAMAAPEVVAAFMQKMQRYGMCFALDDFGAGQTSFRYLRDFMFDLIKIDGQFIRGISANPDNQVLTQALLSICRHFDMFAVAECVESAADAMFLQNMGVDCLQGYYFGAPSIIPPWQVPRTERRRGSI